MPPEPSPPSPIRPWVETRGSKNVGGGCPRMMGRGLCLRTRSPCQALEAAQRMCKAQTPVDMVREYQDWVGGAFQRVMADGVACQEFVGALAGPLSSKQEPAPQHPETRTAQHSKAA